MAFPFYLGKVVILLLLFAESALIRYDCPYNEIDSPQLEGRGYG
jgi:hypothetical protein